MMTRVFRKFRGKLWGVVWHVLRSGTVALEAILHVLELNEHGEDIKVLVGAPR